MRLGIVGGTGKLGSGLAMRWARAGHTIALGSRDPAKALARAAELAGNGRVVEGGDNAWAARESEVVVLTVPYEALSLIHISHLSLSRPLSDEGALALADATGELAADVRAAACSVRDARFGRVVTYSPKVFLPLTNLCRNRCDYCSFRRSPGDPGEWTMTPAQIEEQLLLSLIHI